MRQWAMFAALLAGCYRPALEDACSVACPDDFCPNGMECGADKRCHPIGSDDCSTLADATLDDTGDTVTQICLGDGFIRDECFDPPPGPLVYSGVTFDTTTGPCTYSRVAADGTTLCFLVGTRIVVSGMLRATGANPLVLVGIDEVIVEPTGEIDVSSNILTGSVGAGGEAKDCAFSSGGSNDATGVGGGGGAGGSFTARGGGGGAGHNGNSTIAGGIAATELPAIMAVRGGCPGGKGGDGISFTGGSGGRGGGAVYLLSGSTIVINGRINASGAGGGRPDVTGGAGGGGSGGFIGLDAKTYTIDGAAIFAVGGSGGAGATPLAVGVAGNQAIGPFAPPGTATTGDGGSGGAGGAMSGGQAGSAATAAGGSGGGGGGGGGSMGFIGMANSLSITPMTFAPAPTSMN